MYQYNHFPPTTNLRSLGGTMREKHTLDPNIITDCIAFQDYTLRHTPTITTTKLQRKQEGINQVNQVNTPLFEFLNLDPVFLNFCVIW